jgi:hypothetical protein
MPSPFDRRQDGIYFADQMYRLWHGPYSTDIEAFAAYGPYSSTDIEAFAAYREMLKGDREAFMSGVEPKPGEERRCYGVYVTSAGKVEVQSARIESEGRETYILSAALAALDYKMIVLKAEAHLDEREAIADFITNKSSLIMSLQDEIDHLRMQIADAEAML